MVRLDDINGGAQGDSAVAQNVLDEMEAKIARSAVKRMVVAEDISGLAELMREQNWRIKMEAVRGLAQIGDTRTVEPLILGLLSENQQVRRQSALALISIDRHLKRILLANFGM